jgi:diketogulonate reductase-like aldo/keto reductase
LPKEEQINWCEKSKMALLHYFPMDRDERDFYDEFSKILKEYGNKTQTKKKKS